jgi:SLT domain-containing protein
MRESSGNPMAINGWDINAINGIPSKGLLQVIQPTFNAYHVPGTSWNIYDPVANITAAANYAADKYGSMDNVNSAY